MLKDLSITKKGGDTCQAKLQPGRGVDDNDAKSTWN